MIPETKSPTQMPTIDFQKVKTLADCYTEVRLIADVEYIDALLAVIKQHGSRCVVLCDNPAIKPALVYTLMTRLSIPVVAFHGRMADSDSFYESSIHVVDCYRFAEFRTHIKPNAVILVTPWFVKTIAELDNTIPVVCLISPHFEAMAPHVAAMYKMAGVKTITGIETRTEELAKPEPANPCWVIMTSVIVCLSGFISGLLLCHHLIT